MDDEEQGQCFRMRVIEYHDYKTLMGPCFVSFSLPLLIPGVVLTVVGSYGNEHTFATFGGWHIAGIVILTLATLMLIVGIFLKCFFRPIISADIEEHLSPNTSVITGNKNLGYRDDIYTSSSSLGVNRNNKVSPSASDDGKHMTVSTHEAKSSNSRSAGRNLSQNGDVRSQNMQNSKQSNNISDDVHSHDTPEQQTNLAQEKGKDIVSSGVENNSNKNNEENQVLRHPPPSYADAIEDKGRRQPVDETENVQVNISETPQGTVKTKVTTTVVAEVESSAQSTSGAKSRDNSSDPNEMSFFLPDGQKKKKKKKRKKKRLTSRSTMSDQTNLDELDQSRTELPELRVKPALVHEGEFHHHNPNHHVHFQADPDTDENQYSLNVHESQDFEVE